MRKSVSIIARRQADQAHEQEAAVDTRIIRANVTLRS